MLFTLVNKKVVSGSWLAVAAVIAIALFSASVAAHDAPLRVELKLFAKQNESTLDVLVRIPTDALREIDFPKRGPGYIDFEQLNNSLESAVAVYLLDSIRIKADGEWLQQPMLHVARIALPSNIEFRDFDTAIDYFDAPRLDQGTDLVWNQGYLDAWLKFSIPQQVERFYFKSDLHRLGETTLSVIHFIPQQGKEQVFSYSGNVGEVALNPGFFFALSKFVVMGFEHIVTGIDHILFLLCLVIPVLRFTRLVPLVTAFTLAHSVTLIGAALGVRVDSGWFAPLIEVLIAGTIIYVALENIIGVSIKHRVALTYLFGLVHGFGFSFLLSERLQFAGEHLITSLVAFNIGVELGQLFALAIIVALSWWLMRFPNIARHGVVIVSVFVIHEAWHWLTERFSVMSQFSITLPNLDWVLLGELIDWTILVIIGASLYWLVRLWFVNKGWLDDLQIDTLNAPSRE